VVARLAAAVLATGLAPAVADEPAWLKPCWLDGVEHQALCGVLPRPLDPTRPDGPSIDLQVAVLPALARHKRPDPVFFFAGGPGQSAISLAGPLSAQLARLGTRRDLVLIDQRGTGRSAPLVCEPPAPTQPLHERMDPARQQQDLAACLARLKALPYGDLRQFTTTIAMADADAVRQALGVEQVNLVGGSYGTRAALEYMRQFPQAVRRAVIDGVAPPDMALPQSFAPDTQAAFDALVAACQAHADCRDRYPDLAARWRQVLAGLPRAVELPHPVTGRPERFTLDADTAAALLRQPLYVPALASALPLAIDEASRGRFTALAGLASAMAVGSRRAPMADGMHFSVVCAEDMPRVDQTPAQAAAAAPAAGGGLLALYQRVCADWPRGNVPAAFYRVPPAPAATLLLSGGADPATPPRHAERVAQALGAKARHVVVPEAGHGVMGLGCLRDVVYRFIDAEDDAAALAVDAGCAASIPRPPAFQPVRAPEAAR